MNATAKERRLVKPRSMLLLPPKTLSSCIAAAVFRDTRGVSLPEKDRFNYFPASPLVSATRVISGDLHLVDAAGDIGERRIGSPWPSLSVMPSQDRPIVSWSPGEVCAVTVGFYPDAWRKFGTTPMTSVIPDVLASPLAALDAEPDPQMGWNTFCDALEPVWHAHRQAGGIPDWPGSDRLSDWSHALFGRIARSAPGRSVRTLERRYKNWTGKTRQHLHHFSAIEDLHRHTVRNPEASLAELASDAGFADQSHMGRSVRRSTGFSPAHINRLIETEEPFWCYRLLGERY